MIFVPALLAIGARQSQNSAPCVYNNRLRLWIRAAYKDINIIISQTCIAIDRQDMIWQNFFTIGMPRLCTLYQHSILHTNISI